MNKYFLHHLLLVTLAMGPLIASAARLRRGDVRYCRCAPHQWEGTLNSLEREFDWTARAEMNRETNTRIYYDFLNKLFATKDLETGTKSVIDYGKGLRYLIESDGSCHVTEVRHSMTRMCLPEEARVINEYKVAVDIPVTIWEAKLPGNSTLRTTVHGKHCMPLSEETFMANNEYASLTSTTYADVSFGNRDRSIFQPPSSCRKWKKFIL